MSKRKAQNARRLTKKQVAELLTGEAIARPDLEKAFVDAKILLRPPDIYELQDGRILQVFNKAEGGLGGKGDIYDPDYYRRFIAWAVKVGDDTAAGRNNSVSHWWHYSKLRTAIPQEAPRLLKELAEIILGPASTLDIGYAGLDRASHYIDAVGFERAQEEAYDHLVAYVGEVMRSRTRGQWTIETKGAFEPYPYIAASQHSAIMPVNVVWSELGGLNSADLRREAANEIRRARAKYF
jgi:hypothetical protein